MGSAALEVSAYDEAAEVEAAELSAELRSVTALLVVTGALLSEDLDEVVVVV